MSRVSSFCVVNSSLEEITFCDNLANVSQKSFEGSKVRKVHINAVEKPVSSGTYFDTFPDKVDYLDKVANEKKIILFSGSSTRYGYDSTLIEEAFPQYKVVNMGVFAYVNMRPQLDVIRHYLKKRDILIHSPEFDYWCLDNQFGTDTAFESNLFYFFESDYHNLEYVDVSQYDGFFDAFRQYQHERSYMLKKDYSVSPKHYDDEGNYYSEEIYNIQGDLTLYRENNPYDEILSQTPTPYTLEAFPMALFDSVNLIYDELAAMGVKCYFTYAPKNIRALTEESTEMAIQNLGVTIDLQINVPILGDITDSLFPGTCFYLIDNHLSTQYAKVRTENVIRWLKSEREARSHP